VGGHEDKGKTNHFVAFHEFVAVAVVVVVVVVLNK
jgi:hypothetical protein